MKKYEVDLLISHHQIRLENRHYNDLYCQWGELNIQQGALLFEGFVSFDPIPDESFGAKVILCISDEHMVHDELCRSVLVPFYFLKDNPLIISSAFESHEINVDLEEGLYKLYFDILEGEEVYYQFTLVSTTEDIVSEYLVDDEFGGVKGKNLEFGTK